MFKILKLLTKETVCADVYAKDELMMFIAETEDGVALEKESLFFPGDTLILIEPVEIYTAEQDGKLFTMFDYFLPYSDENMMIVPSSAVISVSTPAKKILNGYNSFVLRKKDSEENYNGFSEQLKKLSKEGPQH